jgi:hypothetical protein
MSRLPRLSECGRSCDHTEPDLPRKIHHLDSPKTRQPDTVRVKVRGWMAQRKGRSRPDVSHESAPLRNGVVFCSR